jgi:non-ribosomal peptide synthetase component F
LRFDLPTGLPSRLRSLCRSDRSTLFTVLFTAFVCWLQRCSGQSDLCIGTGFANRRIPRTEHLIGMLVNTVVLRCQASPDSTFREVLAHAGEVVIEAAANQEYPFARLVEHLRPQRDLSRNPFFQVMFSFHDTPARPIHFGGSPATIYERHNGSAKVDLNLTVIPRAERQIGEADLTDERITVLWEYNGDLFDESTAEQMAAQFVSVVEQVTAGPDILLRKLSLPARTGEASAAQPAQPHGLAGGGSIGDTTPYAPPVTVLEQQIAAIWQDVLGSDRIGVDDNFFDLGGHSLLAMKIVARIRSTLAVELPLAAIFEQPTVAGLSARIEAIRTKVSEVCA